MKKQILILAGALSFAAPAFAQSDELPSEKGVAYIGATTLLSSEYLGSADEDLRLIPYLSVSDFKGFSLFGPSLSYRALDVGTGQGLDKWSLRAGPSLSFEGGRDSDDSENLTGFDDVGSSVIAGGFVRATFGPVGLGFNAGQDVIGGHGGLTANASVGTFLPLGRLKIQPSASINWGSTDHARSFFGVTPEQSAASGLAEYNVDSGIYAYSVNVVSWYEVTDNYAITFIGSHRWFTGKASESPILLADDGSDTGVFVAVGFARKFTL
jgi:outer membrane scaffolding protein for murein synthesis (MipA/OmpV family)